MNDSINSIEAKPTQAEKCEDCIHNGTNKDKITCKECTSIESSQGWNPITESEPNTTDHVLVTYKWDDDDYETSELDYWVNKYEAEHGNEKCQFFHNHIIAWRLKPKPYRGGEDE